ncbi:MAG TPA: replication-relaxation family protein [Solirubrobacteraceae bacterium]|nr:replication-relaxation family protein [Solirubrobacteraceae bacterium]
MFESLHKRLLRRWWRRLLSGQPSLALEVHHGAERSVWLAVSCPAGIDSLIETALRTAYPNCRLCLASQPLGTPPVVLRLKKQSGFITRVATLDRFEHQREPPVNRLMTVMGACSGPAFVQLALTPAPLMFERYAKRLYKRHEAHLSRERREHLIVHDRSMVEDAELRGGLEVQHRPLFFADLRVIASHRSTCERIASELRAVSSENRLLERGTAMRHGLLGLYNTRVLRGEGNPLPSFHRGVYASTELAALWQLPSVDFAAVPFARTSLPRVPAPPGIMRPGNGSSGTLRDALGAVSIHPTVRRQNTAVPGAVDQGKTSYLVATVAEDLSRERCCVIVLDPKGDAAEAAVSLVPVERACTLLDFSHPTCGFNPLAVDAPADVIADYVVAALKNLFTDADIRASSDRYLRNAIIAVLAYDRSSTLWDAARLLSVGEEGYSYRNAVGARLRTMPEFKEISEFFTAELSAQLADSRSTTTAKLDAPVNKLARLLNSPSIKRVLLNDSLPIDFDRVIAGEEVLVVKGALGGMGAGNTSVLMQLLVGMLDAALARQQDLVPETERVVVALKVDEAPLVLNRGFTETMALKRSAGLETVACWQTDSQWVDRDIRAQLDALFAHRVYFATSSAEDARSAVKLTMAEFSDTIRPGIERLPTLGHPDARLYLPKHHAIASWLTPRGRQASFLAETIPLSVDPERLRLHAMCQAERGGRYLDDLRQPHWDGGRRNYRSRTSSVGKNGKTGEKINENDSPDVDRPARVRTQDRPSTGPARSTLPQNRVTAERVPTEVATFLRAPPNELAGAESGASASRMGAASESYRELVELDSACSVRWTKRVPEPRALDPEPLDLEILMLVACMRHVLSSQIHRRFNPGRASTTTQRRLKRLSDAGLVRRFQFHRRDGGGVPMCYTITVAGLRLLHAHDRRTILQEVDAAMLSGPPSMATSMESERLLRQARHDVHVVGWVLALERALDGPPVALRGVRESVLSPPLRSTSDGRTALGPLDLSLPGGRAPHEFLCTDSTGVRTSVERFETVRPDATIELFGQSREHTGIEMGMSASRDEEARGRAIDLLVELDDRLPTGRAAGKLERYDHLLAGWSVHTKRYGPRRGALPLVVFVCRDRARARECTRRADAVLSACRAYAGEYPADWEYPGREGILFVAERDVHEGCLHGYGVPRLPPEVRVSVAHGDPRARESAAEPRELPAVTPIGGELLDR